MRKQLRTRLGISMVGCVMIAAWIAACSGSDDQDVIATPDAASEASVPETSKPDVQTMDTSRPDVVVEAGPIYDAGPATVIEAGPEYGEAGIPCVAGGQLELEPNDETTTANELMPTRCGAVLLTADGGASDSGAAESDFLTFQLKAATKSFYIQFSGNVNLTITVDGQTVNFTPSVQPAVPFVRDKPYFIEVKAADGKRQNWRVTVFESP